MGHPIFQVPVSPNRDSGTTSRRRVLLCDIAESLIATFDHAARGRVVDCIVAAFGNVTLISRLDTDWVPSIRELAFVNKSSLAKQKLQTSVQFELLTTFGQINRLRPRLTTTNGFSRDRSVLLG